MVRRKHKSVLSVAEDAYIRSHIVWLRGVQVMLDFDLARIYGYSTKDFNRQVKNNIDKFDADFMFQLTREEAADLRCKNSTSSWGGARYLPHAFTEQGVYMLMTVLKGELATQQSKAIVRTFKKMKDYILENRGLVGDRELLRLSLQTATNAQDITALRGSLERVDDKVACIVDRLGEVVTRSELAEVMSDFGSSAVHRGWLILDGQLVESDVAYAQIYSEARKSIFVIDNYISLKTLVLLKDAVTKVDVAIFSDNLGKGLHKAEYEDFRKEYGDVQLKTAGGMFHDRYIVIDYKEDSEKIYHCGASSKDGGNRVMTIEKVSENMVYHAVFDKLLQSPNLILK
ncbi:MAG: ORF6N domain-containing protein [Kiritimatiellae bacterium]|nr:ORF6N domain-containing protein [Kiritimatiellia bacterium]